MTVYATSFFVSLYLPDRHSREAQQRTAERPKIWLTPFDRAAWTHAVFQHIFRRKISARESEQVSRHFEQDRTSGVWAEISLPDMAFQTCIELARRHVARIGARTLDTLHVASALELKADSFWTFDSRQASLAAAAGLKLS